ncbi:MAG: UvrB/UvrC motif-containing protein, partial [Acidimicrobiales bacterium]
GGAGSGGAGSGGAGRGQRTGGTGGGMLPSDELELLIATLDAEMCTAAAELRFEYAARLRDEIRSLRRELREVS